MAPSATSAPTELHGTLGLARTPGESLDVSIADNAREKATTASPVFRFAKVSSGAYFYTGSSAERDLIIASFPDFRYEGPAFGSTPGNGGVAVYRFAKTDSGGYFFTSSAAERDVIINSGAYPNFRYEGVTFAVADASTQGAVPVYRLANLVNGSYLLTQDAGERAAAVATGIWRDEGIGFYAYPAGHVINDTDAKQAADYTGYFFNTAVRAGGTLTGSLAISSSLVSGSLNFTQDPSESVVLCAAGLTEMTRSGSSVTGSLTSADPDPGCGFDRGGQLLFTGVIEADGLSLSGDYLVRNVSGSRFAEGGGVFELWRTGSVPTSNCTGTIAVAATSSNVAATLLTRLSGALGSRVIYGTMAITSYDVRTGQPLDCQNEGRVIGARASNSSAMVLKYTLVRRTGSQCQTGGGFTTLFEGTYVDGAISARELAANSATLQMTCAAGR